MKKVLMEKAWMEKVLMEQRGRLALITRGHYSAPIILSSRRIYPAAAQ